MSKIYPSVHYIDLGGNRILIAFKQKTQKDEVKTALGKNTDQELDSVVAKAVSNLHEFKLESGVLLTDDKNNIEEITFNAFKDSL